MEKLAVWSKNCMIRFGAIDTSDGMTLDAVLDFFQEAAISHAENLGAGREVLAQANQAWILSRMSLQIDRRPKYGETVTVRTWPRSGEKLFALRDYDILDAGGKALVRARSCWLIIDREKRRPLRPQSVINTMPPNEGMDALLSGRTLAAALEECPSLEKIAERQALYTDMDYNGHVNNVSYIRWIEDALNPALLEQARQMRLDINYVNEVLSGEVTGIWSAEIDAHSFAFEGRKEPDNQVAFRAELRLNI